MHPHLLCVMGSTASGKSALAEAIALKTGAQLINADAFQVYRGMDVGTGKSLNKDSYMLMDIADPKDQFGLGEWLSQALAILHELWDSGRSAVVVGGTGLYVRALTEGYSEISSQPDRSLRQSLLHEQEQFGLDFIREHLRRVDPIAYERVDLANPLRVRRAIEKALTPVIPVQKVLPPYKIIKIGLNPIAEELRIRIRKRISDMVSQGWIEEVEELLSKGVTVDSPGMKALGYRTLIEVIERRMGVREAEEQIFVLTSQYAKRQRTWMRSEPNLQFLDWSDSTQTMAGEVEALLERNVIWGNP